MTPTPASYSADRAHRLARVAAVGRSRSRSSSSLPEYLPLGARILIYILFALSLDLILGYAGIITLGHTRVLRARRVRRRHPRREARRHAIRCCRLAAAAAAAALLGLATGAVILRTTGLTLLMLTLAITSILLEVANKATD